MFIIGSRYVEALSTVNENNILIMVEKARRHLKYHLRVNCFPGYVFEQIFIIGFRYFALFSRIKNLITKSKFCSFSFLLFFNLFF